MKRKINVVGTGTLTMSIPMGWARKNNLGKGDEVEVTEKQHSLIVSAKQNNPSREISIRLKPGDELVRRVFHIPYVRGYDRIKIWYRDSKDMEVIEKSVPMLFGFDIAEQSKDYCILQPVAEGLDEQFATVKKRMFHVVSTMLKETCEALKQGEKSALTQIQHQEALMNKLGFFCRRMMHQHKYDESESSFALYSIFLFLEDISDHLKHVCEAFTNTRHANKEIITALANCIELFRLIQEMYNRKEATGLPAFKSLRNKTVDILENNKENDTQNRKAALHLMTVLSDLHNLSEEVLYL